MTQDIFSTPRSVTSVIRRRAWTEPRVRSLWLAGLIVGGIGMGFIINGFRARSHEWWLIHNGVQIYATIATANMETIKNRRQPPDSMVVLNFDWHGKLYAPYGRPLPGRREYVLTGSTLPIHVNPDNPEDWTWLDEPSPMINHVIGGLISFPLSAAALLAGLWRRAKLLRIWRNGEIVEALVLETGTPPIAPRTHSARVTPADEEDHHVYTVYCPSHGGGLQRGEEILIVRPAGGGRPAIAVEWFERE